jgi:hypothetical protein
MGVSLSNIFALLLQPQVRGDDTAEAQIMALHYVHDERFVTYNHRIFEKNVTRCPASHPHSPSLDNPSNIRQHAAAEAKSNQFPSEE